VSKSNVTTLLLELDRVFYKLIGTLGEAMRGHRTRQSCSPETVVGVTNPAGLESPTIGTSDTWIPSCNEVVSSPPPDYDSLFGENKRTS
jgi:hypothetical protein